MEYSQPHLLNQFKMAKSLGRCCCLQKNYKPSMPVNKRLNASKTTQKQFTITRFHSQFQLLSLSLAICLSLSLYLSSSIKKISKTIYNHAVSLSLSLSFSLSSYFFQISKTQNQFLHGCSCNPIASSVVYFMGVFGSANSVQ